MLEAGIEMRFKSQLNYDGVMVTVDVRIHAVQAFKDLANQARECLGERDTCFLNQLIKGQ